MFKRFLSILLALVLIASVVGKLLGTPTDMPQTVVDSLFAHREWLKGLFLGLELALAGWLLTGKRLDGALFTALLLLFAFSGLTFANLLKSAPKDCGCFGLLGDGWLTPGLSFGIDVSLALLTAFSLIGPRRTLRNQSEADVPCGASAGFTMIEVLVVIGIIAVLLAIALPVLSQVRASAKMTRCASNLRALGQTLNTYATEHRGYIPRYASHFSSGPFWVVEAARTHLRGSLKEWSDIRKLETLHCPVHPLGQEIPSTYVMNATVFGFDPRWPGAPPTRLAQVRNSTAVPLLVEARDAFGLEGLGFDLIHFESKYVVVNPTHGGFEDVTHQRFEPSRHGRRGSNVLYFDSHVDRLANAPGQFDWFDDGIRWDAGTVGLPN